MGVHEFDQARWLTGGDFTTMAVVRVSRPSAIPRSRMIPTARRSCVTTTSGATVFVSLGRHYAGGDMASVEVFGSKDHVLVDVLEPRRR